MICIRPGWNGYVLNTYMKCLGKGGDQTWFLVKLEKNIYLTAQNVTKYQTLTTGN